MELKKLSEHIWYMTHEEERDRPNLGYVKGDNWSLAIDAGHSDSHTKEFYDLLRKENLPLPSLTVITHWHWDHTFAMHAINGLSLASKRTNEHLFECMDKIKENGPEAFLCISESIRKEYEGGKKIIVIPADIIYEGEMTLDLGGCTVKVMESTAPHTDDSTLVYVCEDSVLFVGDATCAEYPNGARDRERAEKLADKIRSTGAATCVEGHWIPVETDDTLNDLLN